MENFSLKRVIVLLSFAITTVSCGHDMPCSGGGWAYMFFTGFDSASLERVVVVRSDGQKVLDSNIYLLSKSSNPLRYHDSTQKFVDWPYADSVRLASVPFEVRVPNAGKVYHVGGIVLSNGTVHESFMGNDEVCYNNVTSYYLDGKNIETGLNSGGYGQNVYVELKR
jgi:hypothetical protein